MKFLLLIMLERRFKSILVPNVCLVYLRLACRPVLINGYADLDDELFFREAVVLGFFDKNFPVDFSSRRRV